ncbi:hypothetical protein D1872_268620 [compost metagenome]
MPQHLSPSGPVDFGRFDQIFRHIVDGGYVDDHKVTRILPHEDDHDRPKRGGFRSQPRQLEKGNAGRPADGSEPPDKNELPDESQQQPPDDVRHKEDRPHHVSRVQTLR